MDRDLIADALRSHLERVPGLVASWLFGSVARGTAGPDSDVDVAVLFDEKPSAAALLDLEAELCSGMGKQVQLVDANEAPVDLVHRVLRDGILLTERDRSRRIRFEVDARNRYFDMRPILLEYRRPRRGAA